MFRDRIRNIIKESRYIFENFKDKKKKDITEEKCIDAIIEEISKVIDETEEHFSFDLETTWYIESKIREF